MTALLEAGDEVGGTTVTPERSLPARWSRWSLPLTGTGFVVSMVTALTQRHLIPGLWGLPGSIRPTWYLGLILIIAGIVTARRTDGVQIGVGVIALVMVLTLTPSIVYDIPRYTWTAKHLGVVNYIRATGRVQPSIDIYNAWPGLFAAIAWLCRAGAIHDPLVIARWWPPVIDLMIVLASVVMARRLLANHYRAWLAAVLFFLANAIGQDYFSPQAIALFLALVIFALLVPAASAEGSVAEQFRIPLWRLALVAGISLALAATHQITPYLVGASLIVLVAFGFLRPLWAPLLPILPAAVWALINLSVVRRYFQPGTIGDLSGNLSGPGARIAGAHKDTVLVTSSDALALGAVTVGLLAFVFLVRNRRKLDVALAACAASAGTLTLVTNYGNEGILRVTTFALPWLSVLAVGSGTRALLKRPRSIAPVLVLLVATFVMADMALDGWNAVAPVDIQAERYFETFAPDHAIILALGSSSPAKLTQRYPNLRFKAGIIDAEGSDAALLAYLARNPANLPAVYVYTSESAKYYGELEGIWSAAYYDGVVRALRGSPLFTTIIDTPTTQLFRLNPKTPTPPTTPSTKPGGSATTHPSTTTTAPNSGTTTSTGHVTRTGSYTVTTTPSAISTTAKAP